MSGGGSGGGNTTTVQKSDPWAGQQPFLTGGTSNGQTVPGVMPEAAKLYQNNPLQFFQGQTFADLAPETQASLGMQTQRALQGSPLVGAAQADLTKTLNGDYLNPETNPYLMAASDQIMAKTLPAINARFASSGRANSGLGARAASEGVASAMSQAALQNYQAERTNQQRAALMAPQLAQQDYFDAAKLAEVGGVREDFTQQGINEAMQRQQFQNMEPYQRLGLYNQLIQGNYGGQTTQNQTMPRRSLGAGMLGGGVAGGSLGYLASNSLGLTGGQGAALGAGAGSMLGLL